MQKIRINLILPEKTLINQDAAMAIVPGEAGDLGVLYGHMAMVVNLRPGCVCIFDERSSTPSYYYVNSGIAEIVPECCTLLCEEADPFSEINVASLMISMQQASDEALRRRLREKIASLEHPPYQSAWRSA